MATTPQFGAEFTQSIQGYSNAAPVYPPGSNFQPFQNNWISLISHKQTLIRVYLNVNDNNVSDPVFGIRKFNGQLTFTRPGPGLVSIPAFNGPITAKSAAQISKGNIDDTLNFIIPAQDCNGVFDAMVLIDDSFNPQAPTANIIHLVFYDVPLLKIRPVFINYNGVNYYGRPVLKKTDGADMAEALDFALRALPLSGFVFEDCLTVDWPMTPRPGQLPWDAVEESWNNLFDKLSSLQASNGSNAIFMACLAQEAGCNDTCGRGYTGTVALFRSGFPDAAAHEIGHTLGRPHTPCDVEADGADESYPNYFGLPRGSIGDWGVDIRSVSGKLVNPGKALKDPVIYHDIMSYCDPTWPGLYSYTQMLGYVINNGSEFYSGKIAVPGQKELLYQYISFRQHLDGRKQVVEITNEFCLTRTSPPSAGENSDLTITVMKGKRKILQIVPCIPKNCFSGSKLLFRDYHVWIPPMEDDHHFVISDKTGVLTRKAAGKKAPAIRLLKPRVIKKGEDGFLHISWKSKNPVKDIRYTVRFSSGDKGWKSLATGIKETQLTVATAPLTGGASCRIQVIASAGFRSTGDISEPFHLPVKPRQAFLHSPSNDEKYAKGSLIYLSGGAYSPDHGLATPAETEWHISSKACIGKGYQVSCQGLEPGKHKIEMHVPDGMGKKIIKTVTITIVAEEATENSRANDIELLFKNLAKEGIKILPGGVTNAQDIFPQLPNSAPRKSKHVTRGDCGCQE